MADTRKQIEIIGVVSIQMVEAALTKIRVEV